MFVYLYRRLMFVYLMENIHQHKSMDLLGLPQDVCIETVSTCPDDPITGEKMPICSRFLSTEDDGKRCREWSSRPVNTALSTAAKKRYCANNRDKGECGCINREDNPIYQRLRPKQSGSDYDHCWWIPCGDDVHYLTLDGRKPECTDRVCKQVGKRFVNQSAFPRESTEGLVNCSLRSNEISLWDRYMWWIISAIIFIILIVALVSIVLIVRARGRRDRQL